MTKGVPNVVVEQTKCFRYNDIESLEQLILANDRKIACVVLEAETSVAPAKSKYFSENKNFLHDVEFLCKKHGIIFILDEMITGFRWHLKGAQHYYGLTPDLSTFGKCMANGYSVAALGGKRCIMELGSIEKAGSERVFLLSTTHGAEMSGLGAFIETVRYYEENDVIAANWDYGMLFVRTFNELAKKYGIHDYLYATGIECSPVYVTKDLNKNVCLKFRTLFCQEMIKMQVLMPWISFCFSHGPKELEITANALSNAMQVYKEALTHGVDNYLIGQEIKPVFRRYN